MNSSRINDPLAVQFAEQHDGECAVSPWGIGHLSAAFVLSDIMLYFALCGLLPLGAALVFSLAFCLLLAVSFRLLVVVVSEVRSFNADRSKASNIVDVGDHLPVYTILVPFYREAIIAAGIVRALAELTYPREKLAERIRSQEPNIRNSMALLTT